MLQCFMHLFIFFCCSCNMTLTEAARQVHSNRLLACPNVTFMRNLYNLQKQLQDEKRKKRELATAH